MPRLRAGELSPAMLAVQEARGIPLRADLLELFNNGKSHADIAALYRAIPEVAAAYPELDRSTIYGWFDRLGLELRRSYVAKAG